MITPSFIKAPSLSRLGSLNQFSFYFFFYIQVVHRQFGSTKRTNNKAKTKETHGRRLRSRITIIRLGDPHSGAENTFARMSIESRSSRT